jgi:formylglycine-generating enzyme required for sulfatase activity
VTNQQYLEFVQEGGSPPHYWIQRDGKWRYRGFDGEVPLPRDFPVFVSYEQANAYARWRGKALPTEEQFHRAAFGTPEAEQLFPWGNEYRIGTGNFDFCQVRCLVTNVGDSGTAFRNLGEWMEWTSVFAPFPGFEPDPLYPTYSSSFFGDEHHVLKGASCATDHLLLRRSFRNWFRSHYPYAYTTFRLVEN